MPDLSTITPVTREEEFLDRIARAAASPNLPEVDASDNGDVLTVVSGEWAAAAPAGGLPSVSSTDEGKVLTVVDNSGSYEWSAETPVCNCLYKVVTSPDPNDNTKLLLDKTYTEILAAYTSGKTVVIKQDIDTGTERFISEFLPNSYGFDGSDYYVDVDLFGDQFMFKSATADGTLIANTSE